MKDEKRNAGGKEKVEKKRGRQKTKEQKEKKRKLKRKGIERGNRSKDGEKNKERRG